jgi:hypothetical protein
MTTHHLRQFWQLVEVTQSSILHELDDQSLILWLIQRLRERCRLDRDEEAEVRQYIHARLLLIREVA